jgi:hypothetical protein
LIVYVSWQSNLPRGANYQEKQRIRKEVSETSTMEDQINNIIPTIMGEIESDGENESKYLFAYYLACNQQEKTVVNNVMIYLCGWSFETILQKCDIEIDERGEPIVVKNTEDE